LGLLATGYIYQTIASKSDWERYPPPGELIDIGGFQLHLNCMGARGVDQPVVVIEAGSGSASPDWVLVQPEIAKFARACTYDRAGLGWSEVGLEPRSSQQYAFELHTLLEKAGEGPPYILVAHSYGGHTVRIYTQEHPEEVVGMVLVDARLPTDEIPTASMSSGALKLWEFLARCGFFRLAGKQAASVMAPAILENIPDYPIPIMWAPKFFENSRLQSEKTAESDKQVRETGPFGDLPLAVIVPEIPDMVSGLPPDEMAAAEALTQAGQRELANLSTNSQFLIAEGSGHNIPVENPDIIIDVVREIMSASQ
jgi:pimeloyl-ACP methyl ester carboxylesterase